MIPNPTPAQLALALVSLGLVASMLAAWAWAIAQLLGARELLPAAPARRVPWSGKHVLGVLLLFAGVQILVADACKVLVGRERLRGADGQVAPGYQMLAMLAINVTFLLLAPTLLSRWSGARAADFEHEPRRWPRNLVRGLVAWPLLTPIVFGVQLLALKVWGRAKHPLEQWIADSPTSLNWLLAAVSAVVVAPVAEEFLFRGVLLGWLDRWASRPTAKPAVDPDFGTPVDVPVEAESVASPPEPAPIVPREWRLLAANVAVSLVFAGMHMAVWPSPVPLFFLSLGLGVLYQQTGGLVAPVALHATFNGISTLILYLGVVSGGPDALKPGNPGKDMPPPAEAVETPRNVEGFGHHRPARIET